jgi:hypothetical protein
LNPKHEEKYNSKRGKIVSWCFDVPAQRAGCVPDVPAKIAYLSCDLPQNFAPAALLCLLVPAQIQLALRTAHYHIQRAKSANGFALH